MPDPIVSYAPHPRATPEAELSALAAAYRFLLDSAKKKEADEPRQVVGLEDARERIKDARTHSDCT